MRPALKGCFDGDGRRLKQADQDRPWRGSLRRAMKSQRKRIWRAAQADGGWELAHRRERYPELMARTR